MNIIFGNFGNQTIAVMRWLHERAITNITLVSVDTGWAATQWLERVQLVQEYAKRLDFNVVRLQSKPDFQDLVRDRRQFPSEKFQWCAGFLKGLPFLEWLDKIDLHCEARIIFGKRRRDSRANFNLPEMIANGEHFGGRQVWYPLFDCEDAEYINLIQRAGFSVLTHRSLECDPCVSSRDADFKRLKPETIKKVGQLEQEIGNNMFSQSIMEKVEKAITTPPVNDMFNMGCGSPFGCGE